MKTKYRILQQHFFNGLFIIAGILMASIGLKGFLLPNNFLDGGITGLSLLLHQLTKIDVSILIIVLSSPFIILGWVNFSKVFALKTIFAIIAIALLIHFIEIPAITTDKLLISIFGGFFLGSGIGLAIRGGAVIDGSEVLAVAISRRINITVGDFIAFFNVILFIVAGIFINIEVAMYSMLTYLAASKTVDFIINGIEEYIGVMIISEFHENIKNMIIKDMRLGVTVFKSEKNFNPSGKSNERPVLFCVLTRLEVSNLILEIEKIDATALCYSISN